MKLSEMLQQKEIQEKMAELTTVGELYELVKDRISLEDFQKELHAVIKAKQEQMSEEELQALSAAGNQAAVSWGQDGNSWGDHVFALSAPLKDIAGVFM